MQEISQEQALARQRMFREVTTEIAESEKLVNQDPHGALDRLQSLRQTRCAIERRRSGSQIAFGDGGSSHRKYPSLHRAESIVRSIQQERNRRIEDSMALEQATRAKIDGEIQSMVDQYNDLMDKGMFAEAEIVAKKVGMLDPNFRSLRS